MFEQGWYVKGLTTGRGLVVLTANEVALVPSERPKNLAVEMAWGVAGFVEKGARKIKPSAIREDLEAASDLEARLAALVAGLQGHRWMAEEVRVKERRIPLRFKRRGLWFLRGKESIRLAKALRPEELAAYQELVGHWARQE